MIFHHPFIIDNYGFLNKASMKLVTMLKVVRSPSTPTNNVDKKE
jgi:hypothetical protein